MNIIKIVVIFVIFGVAVLAGILPIKVKRCRESKTFMSMANAFSGGLFLAIALVHILPEVIEQYNDLMKKDEDVKVGLEIPLHLQAGALLVQHLSHFHLLLNGTLFDSESEPYTHPSLGHSDGKAPFPLPYILVFTGYTFILIIDRVMFDSHALF